MRIPQELIRAIQENRIVPLVGAGVSVGVGAGLFPTWTRLLEELADELDREAWAQEATRMRQLVHGERFVQAAEVGLRALGAYRFNRFLRQQFRKQRPADIDLSLPRAIWALRPRLVITTNYDAVMRWGALSMPDGSPRDIATVANDQVEELALLHEATSEWPWLWHLHGTIDRLSTIILAGSDYQSLYGGSQGAPSTRYERAIFELNAQLATQSFLYVGFGLSDPYVLQQIADVLALTKFKNAPSFALMKRGEGDRAALWTHYNIQLIEYEDHGPPLVRLLRELAEQAWPSTTPASLQPYTKSIFGGAQTTRSASAPASSPASVPAPRPVMAMARTPSGRSDIPRPALETEYAEELMRSRRLLVLSPRRGGARTLARRIARQRFGERVTWLVPPHVPSCTEAEYVAALSSQPRLANFLELRTWLEERATELGGEHLLVVRHDSGPLEHLQSLGNALHALLEDAARFLILVAGEAACAWLRFQAPSSSLFAGAPVRHAPALELDVVRTMLDQAGHGSEPLAESVHRATGGLPGWVAEIIAAGDALLGLPAGDVFAAMTERLARSASVRGALCMRLAEDDRASERGELSADRHARTVLEELVAGRPVQRLHDVEDQLDHGEVRLYYDGLLVADERGVTGFRCPAVQRAAERLLVLEHA